MKRQHVVSYRNEQNRVETGIVVKTLRKGNQLIVESEEYGLIVIPTKSVIEEIVDV